MRLTFPNGEHPEIVEAGRISLGSGRDNRVQIDGLAEHHAVLANDRRGLWLVVEGNEGQAHVNARPVSRLALVRPGDLISLGRVQMLLRGDTDPQSTRVPPASDAFHSGKQSDDDLLCAARFVLRGVGGTYSGCSFNLCEPLVIGRGVDAQIRIDEPALAEQHARIELHGDRVILRDLAGEGTLVNGARVKDALLNSGDQLAFEQHRFVVEAPGLHAPTRRHDATPPPIQNITQTMRAVPASSAPSAPSMSKSAVATANAAQPDKTRPRTVWWLILAAAALGTTIALLLIYAPRLGG